MQPRVVSDIKNILLVEDNPLDIIMTKKALKEGSFNFRLHVVEDGEKALDFLRRNCDSGEPYTHCPDLILLDLRIPKTSGKEVLASIRSHPSTSLVPVVVVSTSSDQKDVIECYSGLANAYVTKPVEAGGFAKAMKLIVEFWTEIATTPACQA